MHDATLTRIERTEALLAERLHLRGRLADKLASARGRLPRAALAQGRELVDAKARLANPATARDLDPRRIEATCAMLDRHLAAIPEGKFRRRDRSALIGLAAIRVLIVIVLFAVILSWRGLI
ncbi:hypothetical protein ACK8OR_14840 [Jannaschia sp. KMU-145]|uniref:hypothetical protein n=1 Tax=Jannaschia halovivens TaxID=3388667 RepID=UPI00396B151F